MTRTTLDELPVLAAECCPPLDRSPLSDEDAEAAAAIFRALGDPARVKLLSLIATAPTGEACVCDLTDVFTLKQPTISHHLKVLLDAGLVERERRGTWAYYRLRPGALEAAARILGSR